MRVIYCPAGAASLNEDTAEIARVTRASRIKNLGGLPPD